MKSLNILLTNDDGYQSEGILALKTVLSEAGHCVTIIAPDGNRSGFSHCVTIRHPVEFTVLGEGIYSCSGSPADCILYGFGVMEKKPDLVISGINRGFNLSTDVVYSGTAAAAREALLRGVSALALSYQDPNSWHFKLDDFLGVAKLISMNLPKLLLCMREGSFLNINVPKNCNNQFRLGRIGKIVYHDDIVTKQFSDENHFSCKVENGYSSLHEPLGDSDYELVRQGFASITPIFIDPVVDAQSAQKIKELLC